MRNRNSQNIKLGLFVILGISIFVLAVYFIGNRQNLFGDSTRIYSVFKNVSGLQTGNNVRFAGVNVGTVREISIVNDTSIVVEMLISEKARQHIKKNTRATVSSDGLVGSMIVNLVPSEDQESPVVTAGDTIESISKIATADMLNTLSTTNENAALLTADLLKITTAINQGEGTLGALIKDEGMATDVKESISGLRKTTQAASESINRLNRILASVNMEESLAGLIFNDTVAAGQVSQIITNLNESSLELKLITSDLKNFSEELKTGEGVLNYVLKDTAVVNHLEATLQNAEEASEKFDENMKALQHNILFRGYFRKLERRKARAAEKENDN